MTRRVLEMIPSASSLSNNARPQSRGSQRPVSSLSYLQPGSTQSVSSLARPGSSASTFRPLSQLSHRPKSRQQRLTSAKLLPLCQRLVRNLIDASVTGEADEEDDDVRESVYNHGVEHALKTLGVEGSMKAAVTLDMEVVEKMVRGHAEKARIKSSDTLATALEENFNKLKNAPEREYDLDSEIKKSLLPNHVQFLLALSSSPDPSTLTYASLYLDELRNPRPPPESDALTWKKILEEDPYEGEHWIGVPGGLPLPGKKRHQGGEHDYGDLDLDSSPSLSPLDSDDLDLDDTESDVESGPVPEETQAPTGTGAEKFSVEGDWRPLHTTHAYRKEVESLKKRQYWREDWRMDPDITVQGRGTFNIGDASTLGPTVQRVLPQDEPSNIAASTDTSLPFELVVSAERYIYEQDAVREILMALQGRNNIMLQLKAGQFVTTRNTPRLLHLSLASQSSILDGLGKSCTIIQKLRNFTAFIMQESAISTKASTSSARYRTAGRMTHTLEAFADAIDMELRDLYSWCAQREEVWLRALGGSQDNPDAGDFSDSGLVVSLLGTASTFQDRFEDSFPVLLDVVHQVVLESESGHWSIPVRPPSVTTASLLDTLFFTFQQRLERGDNVTADAIMRVFVRSAEPIWGMLGKWLGKGFDLNGERLEDEFFIEANGIGVDMGVLGLLDPDFWADGYGLRDDDAGSSDPADVDEQSRSKGVPSFLQHVAIPVLQSGKAVGLLRALDKDVGHLSEMHIFRNWHWDSFQSLVAGSGNDIPEPHRATEGQRNTGELFSVSLDRLERLIYEKVEPYSLAAGGLLADVVVEECNFWPHLHAIENLYLMRKGDVISDFADVLFAKMDTRQNWSDFHFLNTAFNDVVESSINAKPWIQLSLVRLFYRGDRLKEQSIARTVKAIDGLFLEYAVPFPLTYIFTRQNLQVYDEIFGFLLQIRRAKNVLEKILVRGEDRKSGRGAGLKAFYAMRSRLSWFINTLLNFLTTYIIHIQLSKFHDDLKDTNALSFDQMIELHNDHLGKIQGRCLLQTKTSSLQRAILSILDMALSFSDAFVMFAGDTSMTHDISSRSLVLSKRHQSRRHRRRKRNVVGFAQSINWDDDSSDSDEQEVDLEGNSIYKQGASSFFSSVGGGTSFESEGLGPFDRISKMSAELDGLVKFVRKGVETLAGGTGEAASAFGVLAFLLEDWDLF
ncbi:hypothetical protein D9758_004888 [Tetrapyrgos nigripes]|uniref:Spindle pole body component n=1 Tax=Tetrapyrgos nigripes TaxID=182062 RepID=A0A8H5G668_9AGAR|nr:hypothetical protein D9758_004888 [Tetrapyrgos nigripes]